MRQLGLQRLAHRLLHATLGVAPLRVYLLDRRAVRREQLGRLGRAAHVQRRRAVAVGQRRVEARRQHCAQQLDVAARRRPVRARLAARKLHGGGVGHPLLEQRRRQIAPARLQRQLQRRWRRAQRHVAARPVREQRREQREVGRARAGAGVECA